MKYIGVRFLKIYPCIYVLDEKKFKRKFNFEVIEEIGNFFFVSVFSPLACVPR